MNSRRGFVRTFCIALLAASPGARAQPATRLRRIGVLSPGPDAAAEFEAIAGLMRAFGWIEGRNLALEPRSAAARLDRLRPLADELVAREVDMLVTYGSDAAQAARSATTTIPIVMASSGDPVSAGLVASLARPGGNVTGYSYIASEIAAKLAAVLHEMLPAVRRVCVLINLVGRASTSVRAARRTRIDLSGCSRS
jgi:putative ABC transport system substrate-binding protein